MSAAVDITWEQLRANIHMLAKERGWHHGVPIMSATDPSRRVVLARGCPLSDIHGHDRPVAIDGATRVHVCSSTDVNETDYDEEVNTWMMPPRGVVVSRRWGKSKVSTYSLNEWRFHTFLHSLSCGAGAVDVDAEVNALVSLCKRINNNQRDAYLIRGAFPETSKKSGVTYILRKGLPTIALKCDHIPEGGERRRFLAALCIHPLGWYEGTHVGVCPPSDEVLGVLLQIRADEHGLWKRAHHLTINDPMAAI